MRRAGASHRAMAVAIGAAAIVAGVVPSIAASAGPPACSWPMYGHDVGRSFAQSVDCTGVNQSRVSTLLPAWFFRTADSVTASPAVVDGVVYAGSWDGVMHALDQKTGKQRWQFTISDTSNTAFGRISSSAAVVDVADRRLVIFGGGATLYALDARTGTQLASVCVDPRSNPAVRCKGQSPGAEIEIESSPAVFTVGGETRVVVGMDVHNARGVGRTGVMSFRVAPPGSVGSRWQLEPLWKFDPETRLTYTGAGLLTVGAGQGDGCASVWSSPAVDIENDMVFFGTGSCSHDTTTANQTITSGESLWGVRLSTGAFVWTFDAHAPNRYPSRRWDDDFGASPNLLPPTPTAPFGFVGNGGKDGWYYAVDRLTGRLAWATHAGQAGHLTGDFAVGGMIGSAAVGWSGGEPAIFATTAISTPLWAPLDEKPLDIDRSLLEGSGKKRLLSVHAMRARDGKLLWRAALPRASYGAATYANGVVLVPSTFDFSLKALDAENGTPLANLPVVGAPSSAPVPIGPMVIVGAGTRTTDVEYKAFGAGALDGLSGPSPLSPLSGVWAFKLALR